MMRFFEVVRDGRSVHINPSYPLRFYQIHMDNYFLGIQNGGPTTITFYDRGSFSSLTLIGAMAGSKRIEETYTLHPNTAIRERNFQPGDILVASDNVKSEMTGYMGHSAIVVDDETLVESPGRYPAIVKSTIQQFLDKHPEHAQFRPKDHEIGVDAAAYALDYYNSYKKNLEEGINEPIFSFDLSQSLDDPWEKVYCSKLVWLSYHYGANYTFENDYLWFSPEDLYTQLKDNPDFEQVYKHPNVKFIINT
ncbi:hypothetical protein [Gracilibacillus sp. YIM 98692]|uniref:hypothetical protein n=1 Tax=Gracilibacillus sp. YIM 98692 TaxID=2663532 RepID=UPI0013CFE9A2|nr:hypothetical protein [Gracilibacillus sp. YIM 98692]